MGNVNAYLRENLPELSEARIYVAPNIEEKKLNRQSRQVTPRETGFSPVRGD